MREGATPHPGLPLARLSQRRGTGAGLRSPLPPPTPGPSSPRGLHPTASPRGSASPDPPNSLSPSCFYSAWPRRRSPRQPRFAPRRARPALPLPRSAAASAPPFLPRPRGADPARPLAARVTWAKARGASPRGRGWRRPHPQRLPRRLRGSPDESGALPAGSGVFRWAWGSPGGSPSPPRLRPRLGMPPQAERGSGAG